MEDTFSRVVVIVVALAVLVALVDAAIVRHEEAPRERLLVVQGSSTVEVEPDIARITLGVKATRDTPREAAAVVSDGVTKIKAALAGLGVTDDAIETSELYLGEAQEYDYQQHRTVTLGYKAYHWLRVTLRNEEFGKLPGAIDAAIAAGATTLHDLQWDLEDDTAAKAQALAEATEVARRKADEMAKAAGTRIAGVQRISQPWSGGYYPSAGMASYGVEYEAADEPAAPPAEAGDIEQEPEVPGALRIKAEVEVAFVLD